MCFIISWGDLTGAAGIGISSLTLPLDDTTIRWQIRCSHDISIDLPGTLVYFSWKARDEKIHAASISHWTGQVMCCMRMTVKSEAYGLNELQNKVRTNVHRKQLGPLLLVVP